MKAIYTATFLSLAIAAPMSAQRQDPLRDLFFPPEAIIANAAELGISEEKAKEMQQSLEASRPAFEKAGAAQEAATAAVAELIKSHPVDSAALKEKLNALFDAENALKLLHIETLLAIRNQLTAEQLSRLETLNDGPRYTPEEEELMQTQIDPKLEEFRGLMEARAKAENPPPPEVPKMMEDFHQLIRDKKLKEAIGVLEKALDLVK